MYDLVVHPEYLEELREEVETIVAEHGWNKLALQKMRKVDSFLKESHRMNTVSNCKLTLLSCYHAIAGDECDRRP